MAVHRVRQESTRTTRPVAPVAEAERLERVVGSVNGLCGGLCGQWVAWPRSSSRQSLHRWVDFPVAAGVNRVFSIWRMLERLGRGS